MISYVSFCFNFGKTNHSLSRRNKGRNFPKCCPIRILLHSRGRIANCVKHDRAIHGNKTVIITYIWEETFPQIFAKQQKQNNIDKSN